MLAFGINLGAWWHPVERGSAARGRTSPIRPTPGPPMFRTSSETDADAREVEDLLDLVFAPGRMALSSYRLRDGVSPVTGLCRVARDEYDALCGAIRFWPVRIGADDTPALLLGPVAVHPTRQGEGLGGLLIAEGLDAASVAGWTRALLVGDAPYYGRFGFVRAAELAFPPPTNPDRVLARALVPGALDGVAGTVVPWRDNVAHGLQA